jgi:hypothetical protein
LQPGTYAIKVSVAGFKTFERRDVTLLLNNITRLDVSLEVGDVQQSVTITGEAPVLQTDRAEVHAEVSSTELQNLPIPVGRNYQQVYRTLPGFSVPTNSHSIPTNPSRALEFNVNGTSDEQNNTRIDGVSTTHVQLPHVVAYVPGLESIEEVNVVTNSFDAEQGLAGGAAINVQIKSGTNQLHGSLFEYHTNNHLKAWPWEVPPGISRKPKLVYNQYGGSLGGPIKKDKLFYFASFEGTFDRRLVQRKVTVPTDAMKAGDFSQFLPDYVIYNPYTDLTGSTLADPGKRQPMPGNIIPASLLNTPSALIAAKIVPLWPEPNLPGLKNNYFISAPFHFNRDVLDTKVNYNINSKLNVFGRFSFLNFSTIMKTVFGDTLVGRPIGGSGGTGNPGHGHGQTYSSTEGGSYTFSPTFIMDAYFGFTHQGTSSEQPGLGKNIGLDVLGIPGTNGTRAFESGWPEFDFNGFDTVGVPYNFMPYYRRDPQYQYVVNFSWIKNRHNIRYGMDIYRQGLNQTQVETAAYGAQGGFNFGRDVTALCQDPPACTSGTNTNRANAFASFLLGLPDGGGRSFQVPNEFKIRMMLYSAYIRDRWNVTPRLTIDYGTRWEMFPYPTRPDRGLEFYDTNTNKVLICGMGSVPSGCGVEVSKKRFSPRVGIAWRATNTFVVRAGYGITNDPFEASELLRNNYPITLPFTIATPNDFIPATTLAKGLPALTAPVIPSSGMLDLPTNFDFAGEQRNLHRGYIQSWNFTLQKELPWGFTAQAGYVATRSVRQLAYIDANAAQIPFTNNDTRPLLQKWGRTAATTFVEPIGTATYDSLQTTLQRRFKAGLMMTVNYTWGKALNYGGGWADNSSGQPAISAIPYLKLQRAPTGFDRRHNVEITNIWEVPLGRGKKWLASRSGLTQIVSGWQVNNVVSMISGPPFSLSGDCDAHWPGNYPTMVDIVSKPHKIGSTSGYWYDPSSFAEVYDPSNPGHCRPGVLGNSGFNNLRAAGILNWDFGVFRDFAITEKVHLQFRMESFNFTNSPHFDVPDSCLCDANKIDQATGHIIDPGSFMTLNNGTISLAREGLDERQFRFGLRIRF